MILSFDPVAHELICQSHDGSPLLSIHVERLIVRLLADCGVLSVGLANDAIDVFFSPIEESSAEVAVAEMEPGHWRLGIMDVQQPPGG